MLFYAKVQKVWDILVQYTINQVDYLYCGIFVYDFLKINLRWSLSSRQMPRFCERKCLLSISILFVGNYISDVKHRLRIIGRNSCIGLWIFQVSLVTCPNIIGYFTIYSIIMGCLLLDTFAIKFSD